MKLKAVKASKRKTTSQLTKELDRVFSLFIRQFYANKEGMVKCFTCSTIKHWKEMQNGHYISRSVRVLRWHLDNCRPQCIACNMFKGGNVITYRENLVKELGEEAVKLLEQKRFGTFKTTLMWYVALIAHYKSRITI